MMIYKNVFKKISHVSVGCVGCRCGDTGEWCFWQSGQKLPGSKFPMFSACFRVFRVVATQEIYTTVLLMHRAGTKWTITVNDNQTSQWFQWLLLACDAHRILDNEGRWDKPVLGWEPLNKLKAVWSTFGAYSISTAFVSLMGFSLRFPHWSCQMTLTAWAVKTLSKLCSSVW